MLVLQEDKIKEKERAIMQFQREVEEKEEETRRLQQEVEDARVRQEEAALKALEQSLATQYTSPANHLVGEDANGDNGTEDGHSASGGDSKFRFLDFWFYFGVHVRDNLGWFEFLSWRSGGNGRCTATRGRSLPAYG